MNNCTPNQYQDNYIESLQSIKQVAEKLLHSTDVELNNPNYPTFSSLQDYASILLSTLRKLEHHLFILAETAQPTAYDFWISMASCDPDADGIRLWIEDDCVTILLPSLPHRYKGNQDAVAQMLAAKIHLCSDFPRWITWHADFIHLCPVNHKRIPKDVDNYSYKSVIDVIAYGLHTSDDAEHFDMSMTTVYSDDYEPGVYVKVTPTLLERRLKPSPIARKDST